MLVDRTGIPLEIGCFEGHEGETHTIVPILQFQTCRGIAGIEMIVALAAGRLSEPNFTALDETGLRAHAGRIADEKRLLTGGGAMCLSFTRCA